VIAALVAITGPLAHPSEARSDPISVSAASVAVAAVAARPAAVAAPAAVQAPALPLLPGPSAPHHSSGSSYSSHLNGPAAQVLALTNAQRSKAGCRPLAVDSRLTRVAQQHSTDMARRSYFSHTDPSGHTWEQRQVSAGWSANRTGGENIARGPSDARTVMNGWMSSPPHRQNILDCQFTTIGVGYSPRGDYWAQDFGY
jgi:uncharacterized protein YkwD